MNSVGRRRVLGAAALAAVVVGPGCARTGLAGAGRDDPAPDDSQPGSDLPEKPREQSVVLRNDSEREAVVRLSLVRDGVEVFAESPAVPPGEENVIARLGLEPGIYELSVEANGASASRRWRIESAEDGTTCDPACRPHVIFDGTDLAFAWVSPR